VRGPAAALNEPSTPSPSNDRHEPHEPTPTSYTPEQRQQRRRRRTHRTPDPEPADRLPTPASLHRTLRRTPPFSGSPRATPSPEPRRVHIEAASIGISPRVQPATATATAPALAPAAEEALPTTLEPALRPRETGEQQRRPVRQLSQDLSEDHDEGSSDPSPSYHRRAVTTTDSSANQRLDLSVPHPAVRITKHTHSAILYTLEEALRHPNPFTPDEIEESASMADLLGGGAGAASNGNGASSSSRTRPIGAPAPTGSPGIRGPRVIMQERAAREAARQREQEQLQQLERERAEQDARLLEEAQRRNAERRTNAAAGAASRRQEGGNDTIQPLSDPSQRRPVASESQQNRPQATTSSRVAAPSSQQQQRPSRTTTTTNQPAQPAFAGTQPGRTAQQAAQQPPQGQPAGAGQAGESSAGAGGNRARNSFPHAFERWETLSAHWEGLTSFWIRRLEQNSEEINRDPVSQQLSRQVTDLSAAGANLFHAVVELQRLRASSERKFQRWFFETRAELERSQEVNAMLESALDEERRGRANAIHDAVEQERANSKTQILLTEMRKELSISKEEARRAWEELGRREQLERDRTVSLQSGQPTIVGGVQVVPMTQGVPSRHGSGRDARASQETPDYGDQRYAEYSTAPAVQSAGGSGAYARQDPSGHHEGSYTGGGGSEGGFSEGEYTIDAHGNFVRDSRGNKIPFAAPPSVSDSEGVEEYETPASHPGASGGQYSQHPATTSAGGSGGAQWTGSGNPPQDYSGAGYGAPATWEAVPRHHHPTRLSDVIEEDDERSRTSASQISRG
jgi:hypothetical protein